MYTYLFDFEKNQKLKEDRGVSFETVISLIREGQVIDIIKHSNSRKYKNQKIYILQINNYIYSVPFVRDEEKREIFLKTIFPSRKMTKLYMKKEVYYDNS